MDFPLPLKMPDFKGQTFIFNNEISDILLEMGKHTNTPIELKRFDMSSNRFQMNDIDAFVTYKCMKVKSNISDFKKGFTVVITK